MASPVSSMSIAALGTPSWNEEEHERRQRPASPPRLRPGSPGNLDADGGVITSLLTEIEPIGVSVEVTK